MEKNGSNGLQRGLAVIVFLALLSLIGESTVGAPLCVMEIWTDRASYHPGDRVQLYMWLNVNADPKLPEIKDARLEVELKGPFGGYVLLATKANIWLRKGTEWEELLLTLPAIGEPFRDMGDYEVHAMLLSKAGDLLCEAYTWFTIKSIFGRAPTTRTLIVTSRRTQLTEPFVSKLVVWLEAAFKTNVQVIYQEGLYQAYQHGIYQDYDVIIYYGTDYAQGPPPELILDIFEGEGITKKKVVWIGYHLDKVQGYLRLYGLNYGDLESKNEPTQLLYVDTGTAYPLYATDRISVQVINRDLARVRATADGRPILVSAKQTYSPEDGECFYFLGFHPTAYLTPFGAHLVFLDVLNEVYGIERGKLALIRLEDIHAFTSAEAVLTVANYLNEDGIPFTLALIPIYRDGKGTEVRLSQSRDFRTTIKRALLAGGELVLHGATHQYDGQTAVDYESWDAARMTPIGGAEFARTRVEEALAELRMAGLQSHLMGWATPHYAASNEAYTVFEEYFQLIYEDPRFGYDLKLIPYPVETKDNLYVPTNLGYVRWDSLASDVDRILQEASLLAGLKHGALASFFYHPELGVDGLRQIITGLKGQGWTFVSLSSLLPGR